MNPDERAAQNSHSQELHAVRILTKTLGCTRSEARQAIRLQAAQRDLDRQPNKNLGNHQGNLFEIAPQIKRSEVRVEDVHQDVPRPADPLHLPPLALEDGEMEGEWTTAFVCTEGGSILKQVHTRSVP